MTSRGWVVAGALVVVAVGVAFAVARWPGALPLGSDNDEYLQVAGRLAGLETPLTAGTEATKYPLGYPALLAVPHALGLPVAVLALVLNVVALAAACWLTFRLAAPEATTPAAVAGGTVAAGLLASSAAVWTSVYAVMPDVGFVLAVAAMLTVASRMSVASRPAEPGGAADARTGQQRVHAAAYTPHGALAMGSVAWLTVLAVVATGLKSLGLLVAGGVSVGLAVIAVRERAGPRGIARAALPGAAGLAVTAAGMLAVAGLPEHTTGYARTFLLVDPTDASQGRIDLPALAARTLGDVGATLADLGRAMTAPDATVTVAAAVALVALPLGVVGLARLRPGTAAAPVAAGVALVYVVGLFAWPFHAFRFGLPMLPIAAAGAGWAVRAAARRLPGTTAPALVAVAALVVLTAASVPRAVADGADDRATLPGLHADLDALDAWARANLDQDDLLVSADYREVSRALDRDVRALPYTSDVDALASAADGADYLVRVDLYPRRNRQVRALLRERLDAAEVVLDRPAVSVHALPGGEARP